MTLNDLLQIGLYFIVLVALVKSLGASLARVYQGERIFLDPLLRPVKWLIYRAKCAATV